MTGKDLEGLKYEPLFPYYLSMQESYPVFQVWCANFVTDDAGTGVVHCAPFG